jgi:hypothetical protein
MTSAVPRDRPITRADLEAKLGQISEATGGDGGGGGKVKGVGLAVGVLAAAVVVVGAFWLGNRRGKKRRTVVEVRRV